MLRRVLLIAQPPLLEDEGKVLNHPNRPIPIFPICYQAKMLQYIEISRGGESAKLPAGDVSCLERSSHILGARPDRRTRRCTRSTRHTTAARGSTAASCQRPCELRSGSRRKRCLAG